MKKTYEGPAFDPARCHQIGLSGHGGSCCGISHIYSFPTISSGVPANTAHGSFIRCAADGEMRIRYLIGKYWTDSRRTLDDKKNRLYEVVLQSSQRKAWEAILLRIGFMLVTDFKNTNSGNRVFVYHYAMGPDNAGGIYRSPYVAEKPSDIPNPFKPKPASGAVVF